MCVHVPFDDQLLLLQGQQRLLPILPPKMSTTCVVEALPAPDGWPPGLHTTARTRRHNADHLYRIRGPPTLYNVVRCLFCTPLPTRRNARGFRLVKNSSQRHRRVSADVSIFRTFRELSSGTSCVGIGEVRAEINYVGSFGSIVGCDRLQW